MIAAFLFDAHLPKWWRRALIRRGMLTRVWYVGDAKTPALQAPDPDLLRWCEEHDAALLTNNRQSMPGHLADHVAAGRHVPGIFTVNPGTIGIDELAGDLILIAGASLEGEFQDQIRFLPLT